MTTSVFNQHRRKKRRAEKLAWKREQRHTGGDWKYRETWKAQPNVQFGAEQQGKDRR